MEKGGFLKPIILSQIIQISIVLEIFKKKMAGANAILWLLVRLDSFCESAKSD